MDFGMCGACNSADKAVLDAGCDLNHSGAPTFRHFICHVFVW